MEAMSHLPLKYLEHGLGDDAEAVRVWFQLPARQWFCAVIPPRMSGEVMFYVQKPLETIIHRYIRASTILKSDIIKHTKKSRCCPSGELVAPLPRRIHSSALP